MRTRLHRRDDETLSLTLTDRDSGRTSTVRVPYEGDGRIVTVVADADRTTWWLGLLGRTPVEVQLGTRRRHGIAQVVGEVAEAGPLARASRGRIAHADVQRLRTLVVVRVELTVDLG
jgi:hypothetical protein